MSHIKVSYIVFDQHSLDVILRQINRGAHVTHLLVLGVGFLHRSSRLIGLSKHSILCYKILWNAQRSCSSVHVRTPYNGVIMTIINVSWRQSFNIVYSIMRHQCSLLLSLSINVLIKSSLINRKNLFNWSGILLTEQTLLHGYITSICWGALNSNATMSPRKPLIIIFWITS